MSEITMQIFVAVFGVLTSLVITLISTRHLLRTEIAKLNAQVLTNYSQFIVNERVKIHPEIYYPLSELSKSIVSGSQNIGREPFSIELLKKFRSDIDTLNSKYSIFISGKSVRAFSELRFFIYDLLSESVFKNLDTIEQEKIDSLRKLIGNLEFSLKSDLGIFAVEFNDPKVLVVNNYTELIEIKGRKKR